MKFSAKIIDNCTLCQSFGFSVGLWGFGNVCNVGRQLFKKCAVGKNKTFSRLECRLSSLVNISLFCPFNWFTFQFSACRCLFPTLGGNKDIQL